MPTENSEMPRLAPGIPTSVAMTVIALDWHARSIASSSGRYVGHDELVGGVEGKGVYVFEGRQDSHPERGILYVGQASSAKLNDEALAARVKKSVGRFVDGRRLFADNYDIVLRWASVAKEHEDLIDRIESMLIRSHCPGFNAQEVRGYYEGASNLLLMNAGAKGRLLPVVAGAYFAKGPWLNFD